MKESRRCPNCGEPHRSKMSDVCAWCDGRLLDQFTGLYRPWTQRLIEFIFGKPATTPEEATNQ